MSLILALLVVQYVLNGLSAVLLMSASLFTVLLMGAELT